MPSYSREIPVPGKSSQELYEKVAEDIDRFLEKASIGKFEVKKDSGTKQVSFKNPMISATLVCLDGKMNLNAQLSLMAMPFRSKIDEGIDRWLAKTFQISKV